MSVTLPPLVEKRTPNHSSRHGAPVSLLVWHETAGSYAGSVSWLQSPRSGASAHLVIREDGREATQLVALSEKAWHAAAFNPQSVGIEHANTTPQGYASEHQLEVSARVFGWLCLHFSIPPRWSHDGRSPGIARHSDLGILGGGHFSCGPELGTWQRFLSMVHDEIERGGYRKRWLR